MSWTEPTATDNSGDVNIRQSHHPSEMFPVNETTGVAYIFEDPSGNAATCHFFITVETGLNHCQYVLNLN